MNIAAAAQVAAISLILVGPAAATGTTRVVGAEAGLPQPDVANRIDATPQGLAANEADYVEFVDQDLRSVIMEVADRMGLKARMSAQTRGRLVKLRLPLEPRRLMKALERSYNIVWYVDGDTLNVASASETFSRIVPLGQTRFEAVREQLRSAGVKLDEGGVRYVKGSNSVIVTGPAAIVAKVWALIETLSGPKDSGAVTVIRAGDVGS